MKTKNETKAMIGCICREAGTILLLCVILLALDSALILGGVIDQNGMRVTALICNALAAFAGTLLSLKDQKGKLVRIGLFGCGLYLAVLLLVSLLLPGQAAGSLPMAAATAIAASAAACLTAGRKPRRTKIRSRKR